MWNASRYVTVFARIRTLSGKVAENNSDCRSAGICDVGVVDESSMIVFVILVLKGAGTVGLGRESIDVTGWK